MKNLYSVLFLSPTQPMVVDRVLSSSRTLLHLTVVISLDATDHYELAVYSFLYDRGYKLHVISPIQTDGWRKGVEVRRWKTDVIDSLLIAELVDMETSLKPNCRKRLFYR